MFEGVELHFNPVFYSVQQYFLLDYVFVWEGMGICSCVYGNVFMLVSLHVHAYVYKSQRSIVLQLSEKRYTTDLGARGLSRLTDQRALETCLCTPPNVQVIAKTDLLIFLYIDSSNPTPDLHQNTIGIVATKPFHQPHKVYITIIKLQSQAQRNVLLGNGFHYVIIGI